MTRSVCRLKDRHSTVHRLFRCNGRHTTIIKTRGICSFSLKGPAMPTPSYIGRAVHSLARGLSSVSLRKCASTRKSVRAERTVTSCLGGACRATFSTSGFCLAVKTTTSLSMYFHTLAASPRSRFVAVTPFFPRCHIFIRTGKTGLIIMPPRADSFRVSFSTLRGTVDVRAGNIVVGSPGGPSKTICSGRAVRGLTTLLAGGSRRGNAPVFVLTSRPCHRVTCSNIRMPCIAGCCTGALMYCSCDGSLSLPNRHVNCIVIPSRIARDGAICTTVTKTNHTLNCIYTPDVFRGIVTSYINGAKSVRLCGGGHSLLCSNLAEVNCRYFGPRNTFCVFIGTLRPSTSTFYRHTERRSLLVMSTAKFNYPKCTHISCYISCSVVGHSFLTFRGLCRDCH